MNLLLNRVLVPDPCNHGNQIFIFTLEQVHKLKGGRKEREGEGEEFWFGGHLWSINYTSKEESHLGFYLRLKSQDPNLSVKLKFSLTILNNHHHDNNLSFTISNQKFSSQHPVVGKSKLIPWESLLNPCSGFTDDTGRRSLIEVKMSNMVTFLEVMADVSPKSRVNKNPNGVFFDSPSFLLANHKWFLRFYLKKLNSKDFPAIYLYLMEGSPCALSIRLYFRLTLDSLATDFISYDFGDGAKYDGFGKTLQTPLPNPDKMTQVLVGLEVNQISLYKLIPLLLNPPSLSSSRLTLFSSRAASPFSSSRSNSPRLPQLSEPSSHIFQDFCGNQWKLEVSKETGESQIVYFVLDKGLYHYPNHRTTILCFFCHLLSLDLSKCPDLQMNRNQSSVGYFSNMSDEKGILFSFPLLRNEISNKSNCYLNDKEEVVVKVDFLSVQSCSKSSRGGAKHEIFIRQFIQFHNQLLDQSNTSLINQNDSTLSKSLVSLSDKDPLSPISNSSDLGYPTPKSQGSESFSGNKTSETFDSSDEKKANKQTNKEDKFFILTFLQNLASQQTLKSPRITFSSPTEFLSNQQNKDHSKQHHSPVSSPFIDEKTLISESIGDLNEEEKNETEMNTLSEVLKNSFPLPVKNVVKLGSLFTDTCSRNQKDAQFVFVCEDLPDKNHELWMPVLLKSLIPVLEKVEKELKELKIKNISSNEFSIRFTCSGKIEIELFFVKNFSKDFSLSPPTLISPQPPKQNQNIFYYEHNYCQLTKIFFMQIPKEVKEVIKVLKNWKNAENWSKISHKPPDLILSLLAFRAFQLVEEKTLFKVLQKINCLIQEPELKITWSTFYDPAKFETHFQPPSPLILHPSNPYINSASKLIYWGEFRKKYLDWLSKLHLNLN